MCVGEGRSIAVAMRCASNYKGGGGRRGGAAPFSKKTIQRVVKILILDKEEKNLVVLLKLPCEK